MNDVEPFLEIARLYGGRVGPPGPKLLARLSECGLTEAAISLVAAQNLKRAFGVGSIDIYSEKDVASVNAEDGIPVCLRDGLLIVGNCCNGDPVVVDVRDRLGQAGYVGHETMWQVDDVRDVFRSLAPSLGQLVQGLDEDRMPTDYYEADEPGLDPA